MRGGGPLTPWQAVLLALAAVTVFWMLGAYNRLVSLRNAVGAAWRAVDELLAARAAAVAPLLAALREPLAAEGAALDALAAAQSRIADAARAMGAQAVRADAAAALAQAETLFGPSCARVLALAEAEAALRGEEPVQAQMAALQDLAPRLAFARQAFNDAVRAHNEAVGQFPTRLLARLYGFPPGGSL